MYLLGNKILKNYARMPKPGVPRVPLAHPIFCRLINPIPIGGWHMYFAQQLLLAPQFFYLLYGHLPLLTGRFYIFKGRDHIKILQVGRKQMTAIIVPVGKEKWMKQKKTKLLF